MSLENISRLKIDRSAPLPNVKRRKRFKWIIIAVVLLLIAVSAGWFSTHRPVTIETVTVSRSYPTQTFTLLSASGYVVAQRKAAVASKTTGRLEWIGVREGSRVKMGEVIARLENRDSESLVNQGVAGVQYARANLEQARAEREDARLSFERYKILIKQGIVAQADFDSAETRFKLAVARVAAAEASLHNAESVLNGARIAFDYSLIRAPFDAVVLTKNADEGDIITPLGAAANAKAAVVSIADLASLQVEADVSESNLALVKAGQPCEITLDALPDSRFKGILQTIVPTADRTKASVMIKVKFNNIDPRILPEMSARVAILSREATTQDQQSKITLPKSAIINGSVFLVEKGHVRMVAVKAGVALGDLVEVSGVNPGDKVALSPLDKLADGRAVSVPEK
ncbi:MAG: efflux RND transporter periplasmic adaptor subunit [Desulfuromonadaceae bacterium]|nr:efflux RND transporter periplasmic adaptor subunit [Desulfuromonadaceae bacterium]MDD2856827.1 efflux RND transporter periplasmic adaptor subunit [Desulfuromonadaceae bacterium]